MTQMGGPPQGGDCSGRRGGLTEAEGFTGGRRWSGRPWAGVRVGEAAHPGPRRPGTDELWLRALNITSAGNLPVAWADPRPQLAVLSEGYHFFA